MFQSISAMRSPDLEEDETPVHDYLDDLESFFYLLVYILLLYTPNGARQPRTEASSLTLSKWAGPRTDIAISSKYSLFGAGRVASTAVRSVEATWGPKCTTLFEGFRDWTLERMDDKSELWDSRELHNTGDPLETLYSHRNKHYSEVLKIFDETITAMTY